MFSQLYIYNVYQLHALIYGLKLILEIKICVCTWPLQKLIVLSQENSQIMFQICVHDQKVQKKELILCS
jgi:hypothetical protein